MDERIQEHAEILVDWCTDISEGDDVVVTASPEAHELVVALHDEIGDRGGNPLTLYSSDEASRAYMKTHDGEFTLPEHSLGMYEEADAAIHVRSDPNTSAMSDVDGDKLAERSRVTKPIQEERLSKRWCLTQHPTNAHAQNAGMSLSEYRDFVYGAILRDWEAVEEYQEELRERLDDASEVRVVAGDTDVSMSVDGMNAVNSAGRNNMPSGEVFTAPSPTPSRARYISTSRSSTAGVRWRVSVSPSRRASSSSRRRNATRTPSTTFWKPTRGRAVSGNSVSAPTAR